VPLTAKRDVGKDMIVVELQTKDVDKGSFRKGGNVELGVGCHGPLKERNSCIT